MTHSLKPWNTFGIDHCAKHIVCAENEQQLLSAWQQATREGLPVMILGEGSNVLFLENYAGTVILNRLKGIEVNETADAWHLHVGAGENWHQLVRYALDNNMPGLENLALIPGCVGSSPIQNIGAYGVELQRVCDYVDCVELETGNVCVCPRRNAVSAIVTVSSKMNIRIALRSSRWVCVCQSNGSRC